MVADPRPSKFTIRTALIGAVLCTFATLGAVAAETGIAAQRGAQAAQTLNFGDAKSLAEQAWLSGNVPLANQLAKLLTDARPDDVAALMMLAATETALGRPETGRLAARRAFSGAESPNARYQSSYLVASSAMAEDRYASAQFWLRRAYHAAESETQRNRIEDAFSAVRRASPWHARLSFSIAPSSNVNGGSESPFLIIEDSPFVGLLSGSARALSGWEARFTGSLSYTLSQSAKHRTVAAFHGYRSFVALSDDAEEIAPDAEGGDFEYGVGEIELRHQIADPPGPLPDTISLALGQTWYGGEELDRVARLTLGRSVRLSPRTALRFTAEGEQRISDRDAEDRFGTELGALFSHRLENGVSLRTGLALTNVASEDDNTAYTGYEIHAGFAMAEGVMGMRFSGRVSYRERSYDDYGVGFIDVPGGRDDTEWRARLNLHVDRADVMGFVPVISVVGESSTSNISRFEGESVGVSLGFESAF